MRKCQPPCAAGCQVVLADMAGGVLAGEAEERLSLLLLGGALMGPSCGTCCRPVLIERSGHCSSLRLLLASLVSSVAVGIAGALVLRPTVVHSLAVGPA